MANKMYRQGDLLLVQQSKPWNYEQGEKRPSKVLLLGEATGHAHKFEEHEDVEIVDIPHRETWLKVKKTANLVHDEHHAIVIPIGFYRVVRQREYDGTQTRLVSD